MHVATGGHFSKDCQFCSSRIAIEVHLAASKAGINDSVSHDSGCFLQTLKGQVSRMRKWGHFGVIIRQHLISITYGETAVLRELEQSKNRFSRKLGSLRCNPSPVAGLFRAVYALASRPCSSSLGAGAPFECRSRSQLGLEARWRTSGNVHWSVLQGVAAWPYTK